MVVEVFKTNVCEFSPSQKMIEQLCDQLPGSQINFDLEDCDKILRVAAARVSCEKVIAILESNGYSCEVLA